jgi:hypothetical protein
MAPPKKLPQERAQEKAALEAYFEIPKRKGRPKKATLASDVAELARKNADMANKTNSAPKKREAKNAATSSKKKKQK